MVVTMKCYRIYVNDEIAATVFSAAQAAAEMDKWFAAGYENVEFKIENY